MRVLATAVMMVLPFVIACNGDNAPVPPDTPTPATPTLAYPEPVPTPSGAAIDTASLYPKSLDQMLYEAELVIRASLVSVAANTEAMTVEGDAVYRPIHTFIFTVHEEIKGSAPRPRIQVVVRPAGPLFVPGDPQYEGWSWYVTAEEAQQEAIRLQGERITTWDNRQALLFLVQDTTDWYEEWYNMEQVNDRLRPGSDNCVFPFYTGWGFESVWDYSVDSRRRVWLPANTATVPPDIADLEFITDRRDGETTMTLRDVKGAMGDIWAQVRAGDGSDEYAECLSRKFWDEQNRRERPFDPDQRSEVIASGLPGGFELFRYEMPTGDAVYSDLWVSGDDPAYFQSTLHDGDADPANGYNYALETGRPLLGGTYSVLYNWQNYADIICNYKPEGKAWKWTVTAVAPTGTLHEAFFDPVTDGAAVAADSAKGVLKPASFTDTNGASATIQRIEWEPGTGQSGTVTLEITPHAGIADHILDFIALDGSVRLSLKVADATTDAVNNTLSWTVVSQPWQGGDKLMLRIRQAPNDRPHSPPPTTDSR